VTVLSPIASLLAASTPPPPAPKGIPATYFLDVLTTVDDVAAPTPCPKQKEPEEPNLAGAAWAVAPPPAAVPPRPAPVAFQMPALDRALAMPPAPDAVEAHVPDPVQAYPARRALPPTPDAPEPGAPDPVQAGPARHALPPILEVPVAPQRSETADPVGSNASSGLESFQAAPPRSDLPPMSEPARPDEPSSKVAAVPAAVEPEAEPRRTAKADSSQSPAAPATTRRERAPYRESVRAQETTEKPIPTAPPVPEVIEAPAPTPEPTAAPGALPVPMELEAVAGARPQPARRTAEARPQLVFAARLRPTQAPADPDPPKEQPEPPAKGAPDVERELKRAPRPETQPDRNLEQPSGERRIDFQQTSRTEETPDIAPDDPAAPAKTESPKIVPRREIPLPAPVARDIRLEVASADRKVEVRLVERAGELHIAVRTPDDRLAEGLREHLPLLASRLEQSGFRADEWRAASATGTERRLDVAGSASASTDAKQQRDPSGNGQEQRDQQPHPPREIDEPKHIKQKGAEFAWLMESLR